MSQCVHLIELNMIFGFVLFQQCMSPPGTSSPVWLTCTSLSGRARTTWTPWWRSDPIYFSRDKVVL